MKTKLMASHFVYICLEARKFDCLTPDDFLTCPIIPHRAEKNENKVSLVLLFTELFESSSRTYQKCQ